MIAEGTSSRASLTPPLLALLGNPRLRDRIRIALRMGASSQVLGDVISAADWHQLRLLAAHHPGSPVVIDTLWENPPQAVEDAAVGQTANSRWLTVIWYAPVDPASRCRLSSARITLGTHLLPGGNDDFEAIDAAVLKNTDAARVQRLREDTKRVADPAAFEMFDHALDLATGPCTVSDLAGRVGRTRRTVELRCVALGIPAPRALIALARIFSVHRLAEWSQQPLTAVARALGFSDRSNYRRLVRGVLGRAPAEIQQLGGSDYVARYIVRRLGR